MRLNGHRFLVEETGEIGEHDNMQTMFLQATTSFASSLTHVLYAARGDAGAS